MSLKAKVLFSIAALATAYAFGRWQAPVKTVEVIKTVEVEKKQTDTEKEKHEKTTIVETKLPDGTTKKETIVTRDENTSRQTTIDKHKQSESEKTVVNSSSRLNLSILAGTQFPSQTLEYGFHASKEVIGPVSLGIFGFTDKTVGFSIGLSF